MNSSENTQDDNPDSHLSPNESRSRKKHKTHRERDGSPNKESRRKRERRESPVESRTKRGQEESPSRKTQKTNRRREPDERRSSREKRGQDKSPRDSRNKRAKTRSRSPDSRAVARRYWDPKTDTNPKEPEQSNDNFAIGNRYYGKTESDIKAEPPARKPQDDMLNTRTGGAYIPPARLRLMQAQITDKSTAAYQRIAWEALKKSIHGHINKINVGNIGIIIKQLLKENIVRGRGLLCRSIIQAQAASPTFTNVYAALVAAINSRFPNVGELLLKRLVIQFKRGFKRNDKSICISAATFIAHLVNQRVAHEILALELLTLLVETPTDDSVEVAIAFLKESGQKLTEVSSKGVNAIFEMLRNILHEGALDKRVQYMIEVMFQIWKDGFKDHPAVIDELELVPEEEQFTHLMMLDEATDPQDILNVFKLDEKYEENEQKYKDLSKEILGSDAESGDENGSGSGSGSEESDDDEEEETKKDITIIDNTETNLIALRRTIYLTINSSLDFEECAHKLMKMQLKPGQEIELCHMFLDCCAEQRTYEKFYGLLAQRFCLINKIYIAPFEEIFKDSYSTAHRLDTNRLRNVSKFFAHLLFTDSISWEVLECVKLNEEDTTSSSRIYIKILFQELAEYMGLKKLNDRLRDATLQEAFQGLFPRDNPKNTRFSINFFTSIGLGGLTDDLREHLKQLPKNAPQPLTEINVSSSSSSSSSSSDSNSSDDSSSSSSSSSDSDSEEENRKSKKKNKNDKSKNKSPSEQEPSKNKENDRWGHDGFYETYGREEMLPMSKRYMNNHDRDEENLRSKERRDTRGRQERISEERGKRNEIEGSSKERNRNITGGGLSRERNRYSGERDDDRREKTNKETRRESPRRKDESKYSRDRNRSKEGNENKRDKEISKDRHENRKDRERSEERHDKKRDRHQNEQRREKIRDKSKERNENRKDRQRSNDRNENRKNMEMSKERNDKKRERQKSEERKEKIRDRSGERSENKKYTLSTSKDSKKDRSNRQNS